MTTRRSKREIERELERLAETNGSPGRPPGTSILDEYDETTRELVMTVGGDVIRLLHDEELANRPQPDRALGYLAKVRETYGIEEDRDEDVLEALRGARSELSTEGLFQNSVPCWPHFFDEDWRETFDACLEAGREYEAAAMMVHAAYAYWADRDGGRRVEVPA